MPQAGTVPGDLATAADGDPSVRAACKRAPEESSFLESYLKREARKFAFQGNREHE